MNKNLKLVFCVVNLSIILSCQNRESSDHDRNIVQAEIGAINAVELSVIEPTETSEGQIEGEIGGCAFDKMSPSNTVTLYYPEARETNQINSILKYSGLSSNFKIFAADIDNAIATVIENKRYILYDPDLLSFTDEQSGSFWSSMSILAHEIGHHLSGHTIEPTGSRHNDELEADKFSGFVLYKMGASLSQASAAMTKQGSPHESNTHPAKDRRLKAIERGWTEANNQRYDSAIPPPPLDIINPDGGMDNFGPKNLLDPETYQRLFVDGESSFALATDLEGIILERPKYYDGEYLVMVTKNATNVDDGNLATGDKAVINLHDALEADEMSRAGLSWLDAIMVPGRKIKFSVALEGNQPYVYFTSIRSMPADM